ncbi:ABC transporter ATP-binding protein [Mycolicibacterium agri]|uniref:ABC transporter ATP-binding protein n=1 Tax=Mycolicibacterium agri TaxID=36811 RepID=UPI001F22D22D|nr:ABC transporter ATP-binding protein [Mycolicibacterium agri]
MSRLTHAYFTKGKCVVAVDNVDFDIRTNEFFTLLGPSGCGKTTTLRCIAGLETPTSGSVELGGTVVVSERAVVPTHKRDIGMVFQDYAIWPHMSVFDNVAFPLRMGRRLRKTEIQERVEEALQLVNMREYIDRRSTQLSGGQQQRLSLARALVRRPRVLLLDEPLSNLDAKLREQMRSELRLIQQKIGVTTVFVTHDQVEALSLSSRIAVMKEGRVVQLGTPRDVYMKPNCEFVAEFVGSTTFLPGRVTGQAVTCTMVDTAVAELRCAPNTDVSADDEVLVAVRPEALTVTDLPVDGHNSFSGEVAVALFIGEAVDYRIIAGDQLIRARGNARTQYATGASVYVNALPQDCVVLRTSALSSGGNT